jgi:hypothetical protein
MVIYMLHNLVALSTLPGRMKPEQGYLRAFNRGTGLIGQPLRFGEQPTI